MNGRLLNDIQRLTAACDALRGLSSRVMRGDAMFCSQETLGDACSLRTILEPLGYHVHCYRIEGQRDGYWTVEVQIDEGARHGKD